MPRVISMNPRKQEMTVGQEKVDVSPTRLDKEIQKDFYEAYTRLDENSRYIGALEVCLDVFVAKALPKSIHFIVEPFLHPMGTK